MIARACAIVLHPDGAPVRALCLEDARDGWRLVTGRVEASERPLAAARRRVWEEAGLVAQSGLILGESDGIVAGELWHFGLLRVAPPVRAVWKHAEDQGPAHTCHWQDLRADHRFEGPHARAWAWCRSALR